MPDLVGDIAAAPNAAPTELYMCGPIGLMDAIRANWTEHGLPETNLRFETFGSSGRFGAEEFLVRLPQFDREVVVASDTSILDALDAAGVDTLSDCRKGECGLCLAKIVEVDGTIDHRDVFLSEAQKQRCTNLCLCVSRAVAGSAGDRATVTLHLT